MNITTVRNKPKAFAWSFSKLKNWSTCPKRYFHVDVEKSVREEESEVLKWGNAVHEALANYVSKGQKLPPGMEPYKELADRVKNAKGEVLVEQKLALNKDFGACTFFDRDAWFRGIADVLVINGAVALAVDYKLGKIIEESQQLALLAACVFAHYPAVQKIRTEYWWLKEDAITRADFARGDIVQLWRNVLPRVQELEHAHATMTFPPKPGGLCRRYCPVKSCPHWGE